MLPFGKSDNYIFKYIYIVFILASLFAMKLRNVKQDLEIERVLSCPLWGNYFSFAVHTECHKKYRKELKQ